MNRIPAHRAADLYARAAQPPPAARPAPRAEAPAATIAPKAARPVGTADLSSEETRAIEAFFPPAPALTLRLYGPGRETQRVSPETLGGRLDLRG